MHNIGVTRSLVMDAIANDYEDLATITREVSDWAAEEGLGVGVDQVAQALMRLIDMGFAKAYRLSPSSQAALVERPDVGLMAEYYFLLTPEGRAAIGSAEAESG